MTIAVRNKRTHRLHHQPMFHHLQPLMQSLLSIPFLNSYLFPAYDWPGIYLRRHEMDAAPGDFHASIEGLSNRMQSTKDGYLCPITRDIYTTSSIIGQ